jgi:type I restriction enzyme S subunit
LVLANPVLHGRSRSRQFSSAQFSNRWDIPILLPPLGEQQRIATILEGQLAAVERARAAAKAQLSTVDTLPAAYLRAVFNSSLAKAWPTRTIGEVAKVQSGFAFKSEWFAANGIRLLRNANIFQGRVAWDDEVRLPIERQGEFREYELSVGDIVLSLDRPVVSNGLKVARLTAADVPALLLQRVGRFRLSGSAEPDYVYAFLNSETFIAAITQHDYSLVVPHVSPKQVEAVAIPLPPLPEQRRISAILRDQTAGVERSRKALREQLNAINALPAALLRRAFSGEL